MLWLVLGRSNRFKMNHKLVIKNRNWNNFSLKPVRKWPNKAVAIEIIRHLANEARLAEEHFNRAVRIPNVQYCQFRFRRVYSKGCVIAFATRGEWGNCRLQPHSLPSAVSHSECCDMHTLKILRCQTWEWKKNGTNRERILGKSTCLD